MHNLGDFISPRTGENMGKVAMADGKENAALAEQTSAEAEKKLAEAERIKAPTFLCVGVATGSAALSLLSPNIATHITNIALRKLFLLGAPALALLSSAVIALATYECFEQVVAAMQPPLQASNTRLPSSLPLRTQLAKKWSAIFKNTLPAIVIGLLCPGSFAKKAIVCTAIATLATTTSFALSEYLVAAAMDSVASRARCSSVADTYAEQGMRAGAVLPFLSSLAGLCAAGSVAVGEILPLIHNPFLQSIAAMLLPAGTSLFAAAATISKAKCEVGIVAYMYTCWCPGRACACSRLNIRQVFVDA